MSFLVLITEYNRNVAEFTLSKQIMDSSRTQLFTFLKPVVAQLVPGHDVQSITQFRGEISTDNEPMIWVAYDYLSFDKRERVTAGHVSHCTKFPRSILEAADPVAAALRFRKDQERHERRWRIHQEIMNLQMELESLGVQI